MNSQHNIKKAKKFVIYSLLLSLGIHVLFLATTSVNRKLTEVMQAEEKSKEKRIKLRLRTDDSKPKQIVTSEKSKKKKRDPKAKFLSKNTQSFDRQSAAKNVGSFKVAGEGQRDGRNQPVKKPQKQQQKQIAKKESKQEKVKKGRKSKQKKISMADLAVGKKAPKIEKKVEKKSAPSLAALGLKNGQRSKTGLSANNDFVEDIPLGDMTKLNTVEFKYYGFYHRIKQKLEQYWGNTIQRKAEALWKSGRRLASKNRITSLEIVLDNRGNIVKINVKGSSGVRELDDAAIESFNKAGPFPNPPRGMFRNGLAKLEWGFVVKS